MQITLFTIGRLKDRFWGDAQNHFEKMLRPYCQLDIEELKDEPLTKGITSQEAKKREGERILKWVDTKLPLIIMDDKGKSFSSHEFSTWLATFHNKGGKLQFVIGGPYGIDDSVKKQATAILSLSALTLPHQLARIVFLEQLYRAFTILKGKTYHY